MRLLTPVYRDCQVKNANTEIALSGGGEAGPAEALRGMRRAMAQRMAAAHAEVVPATVTDDADIGEWRTGEDPSVRLMRAIAAACSSLTCRTNGSAWRCTSCHSEPAFR